ncbi:hypothetical protein [Flavobacterium sp.]
MAILVLLLLWATFIFLFYRELIRDKKNFKIKRQQDNEHILREVERFVKKMNS